MNNLLTLYTVDVLEVFALWETASLIIAFLIAGLILFIDAKSLLSKYIKTAILWLAVYALVVGIVLLIFDIIKHYDPAYLEKNYVNC